jgi:hypothetical protein
MLREGEPMKRLIVLGCLILFFIPMSWAQEKCEAPAWKTGDKWTFKRADGITYTNQVVDVKNDLFIVKIAGDPDLYGYDRETANLKFMIKEDGRQMKATNDLRKLFNFPIFVGKKWTDTNSRLAGGLSQQQEMTFLIEFNVEGIENLTTAAGTFRTYKIRHKLTNSKSNKSGWILFWYSPDVKWWVKREVEKSSFWGNLLNAELISYELK